MENILENTYYESDTSFTAPLTPTTPNADSIKNELLYNTQLDSDVDDDQDSEYQEAAQAIENNLLKDIGSDTETSTTIGLTKIKEEFVANKKERKPSMSFGDDIIFPGAGMRRNSEQERDRQKRKEMRSKRELEEEEREKMQYVSGLENLFL